MNYHDRDSKEILQFNSNTQEYQFVFEFQVAFAFFLCHVYFHHGQIQITKKQKKAPNIINQGKCQKTDW